MEEYKQELINNITNYSGETIEEIVRDNPNFIVNRNEDGKIHSQYLGDRYEPAIIYKESEHYVNVKHYYLFDGDILDCEHPFCIAYNNNEIVSVIYYSSERIQNEEPIYIDADFTYYNMSLNGEKILDDYESKSILTAGIYFVEMEVSLDGVVNWGADGGADRVLESPVGKVNNMLENFSVLCNEMSKRAKFKFAD